MKYQHSFSPFLLQFHLSRGQRQADSLVVLPDDSLGCSSVISGVELQQRSSWISQGRGEERSSWTEELGTLQEVDRLPLLLGHRTWTEDVRRRVFLRIFFNLHQLFFFLVLEMLLKLDLGEGGGWCEGSSRRGS